MERGQFTVYAEGDYYRVCNTTKFVSVEEDLDIVHLPFEEGLAIEEKQKDGTYIVICFVVLEGDIAILEDVVGRVATSLKDAPYLKLAEFTNSLNFATEMLNNYVKENKEGE